MRYSSLERFFTGFGSHNFVRSEPVFRTDDFTDDECKTLASSVQRELDELNEMSDDELYFDLGPAADENLEEFILLKTKWAIHEGDIEDEYGKQTGSWRYDMHLLNKIAREHAEIIRDLKRQSHPQAFLQCRLANGEFSTFARVDSLSDHELNILATVLETELNRLGTSLRVVTGWHAASEPHEYVQAKLDYEQYSDVDSVSNECGHDYEYELASERAFERCVAEVRRLRLLPKVSGQNGASGELDAAWDSVQRQTPSEALRTTFRDPDNYWRNVWLYQLRKEGKQNAAILAALAARGQEFALLESENALRNAIETIATHHGWPLLKGKPGRPKATGEA